MIKKLLLSLFLVFILTTNSFAAAISTLIDNFNDNSIDAAKWTILSGSPQETNSELECATVLTGRDNLLRSTNTYDLTGSQATIKLVDAGNQALASWYVNPLLIFVASGSQLAWYITQGTIYAQKKVTTWSNIASASYVAATHKYLKIREASGTIYWDYSANGISWTNFASVANPFAITAFQLYIEAEAGVELSTTTAKLDDFNYPSTSSQVIIVSE